ncbi:MAG: transcription elongation factor GreB [Xanthomonadales bacterium]|nr:transcription elongation factor GreB [Xanthomonadales bacterium]
MGRWRPSTQPGSPYITPEGAKALREEHQRLWRIERPEVVQALAAAAAEGDRSENAEYTYRKKQLGGIDRRLRYLGKQLDRLKVVDRPPADSSRVFFGAWVTVRRTDRDEEVRYRIVGSDETDARRGWISVDAPLSRGLLGKRVGDAFQVRLPEGVQQIVITAISYTPPEP